MGGKAGAILGGLATVAIGLFLVPVTGPLGPWLAIATVGAGLYSTAKAIGTNPPNASASSVATGVARNLTVATSSATHKPIFGQSRAGLVMTWYEKTADGKLYTLYTAAPHAVAEIGAVYFDDVEIVTDVSGNAVAPATLPDGTTPKSYVGVARIIKGRGTVADDAALHNFLMARTKTWTADCKQDGRAKLVVEWTYVKDVLTGNLPNVTTILKGFLAYDPRGGNITITSSSVADPSVFTLAASHSFNPGDLCFVRGHAGSVPPIKGVYEIGTTPSSSTVTLLDYSQDLAVSTGGSGGGIGKLSWTDNPALLGVTYCCDKVYGLPSVFDDEFVEVQVTDAANSCDEYVTRASPSATFTADASTDLITYALTGTVGDLPDYAQVTVASSTTLPAGLSAGTVYTFKQYSAGGEGYLCASLADAQAVPPVPINITGAGSGTHTLTLVMTFTVNLATGYSSANALELYSSSLRILTGDKCRVTSTTTLPSGLSAGTDYYAIFLTERRIRLASSLANARDGVAITLASSGTGTHKITVQAELRYTANGVVDSATDPKTILEQIAETTAGDFIAAGASLGFWPGVYRSPSVTLTDDDLRGAISLQRLVSGQDSFNAVKGSYFDAHARFMPADFPSYQSATYVAADNGETVWADFKYELINSPFKAQRVARIALEKVRRERTLTLAYKFTAFRIAVGDVFQVTNGLLGLSSATYEAKNFGFSIAADQNGIPALNVDIVARQTDSGVFSWSSSNEVGAKRVSSIPAVADVLPAPSGLTGFSANGFVTLRWNSIVSARVAAYGIVDAPLSGTIDTGALIDAQHAANEITTAIADGDHTFYVFGIDLNGNRGPASSVDITGDAGSGGGGGFSPVTNQYDSGSFDETVPVGATSVTIRVYGPGGGNGADNPVSTGGGGGGYSEKTAIAIVSGDWGTTLSWGAGTGGAAGYYNVNDGNIDGETPGGSFVTATLTNWSGSMTADGGQGGITSNDALPVSGGTAAGGDTNTTGDNGTGSVGGANNGPGGGAAASHNSSGNAPGGGAGPGLFYTQGANGRVVFVWR